MSRDPRPRGFADVQAHIDPVRTVEHPQNAFHLLRQFHHFVSRGSGQLLQFIEMSEWNNHHMPRRIRIRVENDVAILAAVHDANLRDRKSTRLNSSHGYISYAVFCLKKKNK